MSASPDPILSEQFDAFRADVAAAMAGIVTGDPAATWRLHELSASRVRPMLWHEADRIGVRLSDDDLDELHIDVTLDLARRAASWSPYGALPWNWARRRVLAAVHAHIGQFTRSDDRIDDVHAVDRATPEPAIRMTDPLAELRRLAQRDRRVTPLLDLLHDGISERDAAIWVEHRLEVDAGNRRPAVTVGADHQLSPVAVRKVVQRVNAHLARHDFDLAA